MVSEALRDYILERDGQCVAAALDRGHQCADKWAEPHPPNDLARLTLEHVKDEPMMGRKASSDEWHMVAMCWRGNVVDVWGSANRPLLRAYLAGIRRAAA